MRAASRSSSAGARPARRRAGPGRSRRRSRSTKVRCNSAPASRACAARRLVRIERRGRAARPSGRAPAPASADPGAGPAVPGRRGRAGGWFFDRLVFAAEPIHAAHVGAYERALRERSRLLAEDAADPAWSTALEGRMAEAGARMAEARGATLSALQVGDRFARRPAVSAGGSRAYRRVRKAGDVGRRIGRNRSAFGRRSGRFPTPRRGRRTRAGPRSHRSGDHPPRARAAGGGMFDRRTESADFEPGTAQARDILTCEIASESYIIVDEAAAHLDQPGAPLSPTKSKRSASCAFLTGTDEALFDHFKGRALGVRVDASRLELVD